MTLNCKLPMEMSCALAMYTFYSVCAGIFAFACSKRNFFRCETLASCNRFAQLCLMLCTLAYARGQAFVTVEEHSFDPDVVVLHIKPSEYFQISDVQLRPVFFVQKGDRTFTEIKASWTNIRMLTLTPYGGFVQFKREVPCREYELQITTQHIENASHVEESFWRTSQGASDWYPDVNYSVGEPINEMGWNAWQSHSFGVNVHVSYNIVDANAHMEPNNPIWEVVNLDGCKYLLVSTVDSPRIVGLNNFSDHVVIFNWQYPAYARCRYLFQLQTLAFDAAHQCWRLLRSTPQHSAVIVLDAEKIKNFPTNPKPYYNHRCSWSCEPVNVTATPVNGSSVIVQWDFANRSSIKHVAVHTAEARNVDQNGAATMLSNARYYERNITDQYLELKPFSDDLTLAWMISVCASHSESCGLIYDQDGSSREPDFGAAQQMPIYVNRILKENRTVSIDCYFSFNDDLSCK